MDKLKTPLLVANLIVMLALLATNVVAHGGDATLIHSCINNSSGTIKIVGANGTCGSNEIALDWNQQGPQGSKGEKGDKGDPGTFTGVFQSDNGLFSLSVTDAGIVMNGPTGKIQLLPTKIEIAATIVEIDGTPILLNGGCTPIARLSDDAVGVAPPYGGSAVFDLIATGNNPQVLTSC